MAVHRDRLRFSARENRHLGDVIEAAGGKCLLDTRVRDRLRTYQNVSPVLVDQDLGDAAYTGASTTPTGARPLYGAPAQLRWLLLRISAGACRQVRQAIAPRGMGGR